MASKQLVVFTLNGEDFGIEITQVNEIIRPIETYKVPNTPEYIEGLINLRGKVHTVVNLRKRFNLPSLESTENQKIIIANVGSSIVGFIVDEVKEIVRIEEENIESTPSDLTGLKRRYIDGIAKAGESIILLLDLNAAISTEE
jgi:purine-binding chemotaxis protein CheW